VILATMGLVAMPLLVRVGLVQLVLHVQRMRTETMIMMMMSNHCLQRQPTAVLSMSLLDLCGDG